MNTIVYRYDGKKNPQGDLLDRVPLRDVTAREWEQMPDDLQAAVAGCPFYVKVSPSVKIKKAAGDSADKEGAE